MHFDWDKNKSLKNAKERGIPFDSVRDMDFHTAVFEDDARKDYGERRVIVYGMIKGRLHVLCFTPIKDGIRVISLRKANDREVRHYEKTSQEIEN